VTGQGSWPGPDWLGPAASTAPPAAESQRNRTLDRGRVSVSDWWRLADGARISVIDPHTKSPDDVIGNTESYRIISSAFAITHEGRDLRRGPLISVCLSLGLNLLQMDHLTVQGAVHLHPLAFVLLNFILMVDIISLAAGFVFQHIPVA
jgi:hypothetical protein